MSLETHQNLQPILSSSRDFSSLKRAKDQRTRIQQQHQHHHVVPNIQSISSSQLLNYASQLTHKNLRRTSSQPEMKVPHGRYSVDSSPSSPTSPLPQNRLDYNQRQQHPNGKIGWARKSSFDSTTSSIDDECSLYSYYNSDTDDQDGTTSDTFDTMYEIIQRKLRKHLRREEIFSNREIQKVCQELRRRALVMELQDGWQSSLSDLEIASGMKKEVLEAIYLLRNAHKSDLFSSQESIEQPRSGADKTRSVGSLDIESSRHSTRRSKTETEASSKGGRAVFSEHNRNQRPSDLDGSDFMIHENSKRQRRLRSDDALTTTNSSPGIHQKFRSENSDPALASSSTNYQQQHLQTLSKSSDRIQNEIYDFQNKLAHQSSSTTGASPTKLFHNHRHRHQPHKKNGNLSNKNISASAPTSTLDLLGNDEDTKIIGTPSPAFSPEQNINPHENTKNTDLHSPVFSPSSSKPKEQNKQSSQRFPNSNDKENMNFEDSNPTYRVFAQIFQQPNNIQQKQQAYDHGLADRAKNQSLQKPEKELLGDTLYDGRRSRDKPSTTIHISSKSNYHGIEDSQPVKDDVDGRTHVVNPSSTGRAIPNNFNIPGTVGNSMAAYTLAEDKPSFTTKSIPNKLNTSESHHDESLHLPVEEFVESIVVSTTETVFESEPTQHYMDDDNDDDDEMVIIPQNEVSVMTTPQPPSSVGNNPTAVIGVQSSGLRPGMVSCCFCFCFFLSFRLLTS